MCGRFSSNRWIYEERNVMAFVEDQWNQGSKEPVARHERKCTANRTNGTPCERWAIAGGTVCPAHGGRAPQVKRKARQRIEEAADRMARRVLRIADSDDVPPAVALAAARDALDRAGLRPPDKVDVEVGVKPYESLLGRVVGMSTATRSESRARRGIADEPKAIGADDADIVDAEIVDEPRADGGYRAGPTYRDDADDNSRGGPGPNTPPPGTALMTFEQANRIAAESNRRSGVYNKRYRR